MHRPGDRARFDIDLELVAVLGFVLAIILANQAPLLLGLFGALVFLGWLLVQLGVFDGEPGADSDADAQREDPLETLQTRYARGEIDEAEFERRLDRIVESSDAVRGTDRTRGQRAPADPDSLDGLDEADEWDLERS